MIHTDETLSDPIRPELLRMRVARGSQAPARDIQILHPVQSPDTQFSSSKPGTLVNSRVLLVTSTAC